MCLVRGEVKTDNAKFEIVMNIANTDHSQSCPNIAHQVKGPQLNNCKTSTLFKIGIN